MSRKKSITCKTLCIFTARRYDSAVYDVDGHGASRGPSAVAGRVSCSRRRVRTRAGFTPSGAPVQKKNLGPLIYEYPVTRPPTAFTRHCRGRHAQ